MLPPRTGDERVDEKITKLSNEAGMAPREIHQRRAGVPRREASAPPRRGLTPRDRFPRHDQPGRPSIERREVTFVKSDWQQAPCSKKRLLIATSSAEGGCAP